MKTFANYNFSNQPTKTELKSREIAYRAALESIVLLENNGCLPLKPGKVALYGYGAEYTVKGGSGSGDVNQRYAVSIREGLENAGFEVLSKDYLKRIRHLIADAKKTQLKDTANGIKKNPNMAAFMDLISLIQGNGVLKIDENIIDADLVNPAETDTAIYVATRQAGEGADRKLEKGENDLSPADLHNLRVLGKTYKNVILVINVGSSLDMGFMKKIPPLGAILYFAQQGEEGGNALADLLKGKVAPSGKLTDTWAKYYEDIPYANEFSYLKGDVQKEYYKEGLMVGYRYFDSYHVEPQYPFGYGLSYTTFNIDTKEVTLNKTEVTLTVSVTNTGDYAGKEVVQVYQSAPAGLLKKEAKALVAFGKTKVLEPGEAEDLTITYDFKDTASYQELGAEWILDKGNYIVRVGNSSANVTNVAVLELKRLAVTERATNICPVVNPFEEMEIPVQPAEDLAGLPVLTVKNADIKTVIHDYSAPKPYHDEKVDEIMSKLTIAEKAELCCGGGMTETVRPINCRGAVGHTTLKLLGKGVPNVELCDGPAGVRIAKETHILPDGTVKAAGLVQDTSWLPKFLQKEEKKVSGEKIAYQYATAWPVSIAQAQTWNMDLIHEIGTQVGQEMKEFACTYWLAPGVNLHRNPLCGRNFEYYSEDPFLTGMCAASLISGVQTIPGNYVAMKHYACNNQEDGRMGGDSILSERTLRELYLKGFGIAVKKAHCSGIMSSYNKINGVPASACHDTLTKVLRNEWGFDGVVMSDWFGSMYSGKPGHAVKAGNDLNMPGIGVEGKLMMLSLKLGLIQEADIERSASYVLHQILESEAVRQMYAGEMVEIEEK